VKLALLAAVVDEVTSAVVVAPYKGFLASFSTDPQHWVEWWFLVLFLDLKIIFRWSLNFLGMALP
jgi:hypothetical protein